MRPEKGRPRRTSPARIARSALAATASAFALLAALGGALPAAAQPSTRVQSGPLPLFLPDPTQISIVPEGRTPASAPAEGIPPTFTTTRRGSPMQVHAEQLVYDDRTKRVTARGRVQIYYDGRTIEADTVTYDQRANRVRATGNVRVTEPSGIIAHGQDFEFDQDFRNGFVRSLNIETPDRRFFGANTVTRRDGDVTVFEEGVYTACDSCRADRTKPPTWQIKSKRIIHSESERTIHFEDMRFEAFGVPIAYAPYLTTPDPTVRKATGFLMPTVAGSNRTGIGLEVPFFWNIQPDYDLLIAPRYYSRQGFMPLAEWRQGFESGFYTLRGAAIWQQDPSVFVYSDGTPEVGNRTFRGALQTLGLFRITERWTFGWDINILSDTAFLRDYALLAPGQTEANNRLFLRGQGPRSWFDLSATRYVGITAADVDNKILPVALPSLDYFRVFDRSVAGGELSWRTSIVNVAREAADVRQRDRLSPITCDRTQPRSATNLNPLNCLVNGIDGYAQRASAEVAWRRRITDALGQVWEPFVSVRGDISYHQLKGDGQVLGSFANLAEDRRVYTRFMPTVGMTYRYPWIAASTYGTTTVEPIVQFIARPNEQMIGHLPNEDAQSLVFDDTNLFQVNKFSGWDRVEGGGRVNYGLSLTHRFTSGSSLNMLFGQSLHVFGINSFAFGDPGVTNSYDASSVGANSGLDRPRSDYVARLAYQTSNNLRFVARGRFDEGTFALQRAEIEGTGRAGPLAFTGTFAYLAAQPLLGYQVARSAIGAAVSYSVGDNWTLYAAARYSFQRQNLAATTVADLVERDKVESMTLGINYLDECFQLGFYYSRDFAADVITANNVTSTRDVHRFMFRFNLRTLGEVALSQNVSNFFNPPAR